MNAIWCFLFLLLSSFSFGNTPSVSQLSFLNASLQQEMDVLKDSQNPEPDKAIEFLIVLSASNSYLKNKSTLDVEDDYNRMQLAIKTAKKIAALRAKIGLGELNTELLQKYGPKIIYNGSDSQNNDLKYALEHCLIDYPQDKFLVLPISPQEINTKGQFQSLKQYLALDNTSVGIITHAYHFPRVSRMLGKNAPLYPFGCHVSVYAFLVDREFLSPGIKDKVEQELKNIPRYIEKGDLAEYPASAIIFLQKSCGG